MALTFFADQRHDCSYTPNLQVHVLLVSVIITRAAVQLILRVLRTHPSPHRVQARDAWTLTSAHGCVCDHFGLCDALSTQRRSWPSQCKHANYFLGQ